MTFGIQNMAQSSASDTFLIVTWYVLNKLTKKSNIFKIPMLAPFDRIIGQNMAKSSKMTQISKNYHFQSIVNSLIKMILIE